MSTLQGGGQIISKGLILYLDAANLKSYTGSGNSWDDLTKNSNNGQLTNGPIFSSDKNGSIVFDGTDDYIQVNNSDTLNPTQTITLCAWAKFDGSYTGFSAPIIFKKNNGSSYFEQYFLGFTIGGEVNVALGNGTTNEYITTSSSYTNQLINIVGVIDTGNSIMRLHINGVLDSSLSISYPSMDVSSNPLIIGSYNQLSFNGFMGGNIYNVSIYDRALTLSEILQNYNTLKTRFTT